VKDGIRAAVAATRVICIAGQQQGDQSPQSYLTRLLCP
jgi:hypothetical protein